MRPAVDQLLQLENEASCPATPIWSEVCHTASHAPPGMFAHMIATAVAISERVACAALLDRVTGRRRRPAEGRAPASGRSARRRAMRRRRPRRDRCPPGAPRGRGSRPSRGVRHERQVSAVQLRSARHPPASRGSAPAPGQVVLSSREMAYQHGCTSPRRRRGVREAKSVARDRSPHQRTGPSPARGRRRRAKSARKASSLNWAKPAAEERTRPALGGAGRERRRECAVVLADVGGPC